MFEIWEKFFAEKQELWGSKVVPSAIIVKDYFLKKGINNILIPGFGYGRNARVFVDSGINVTGIEISKSAIDLAKKYVGKSTKIFHGSVCDMPYDDIKYDGIFCYSLIHLLNKNERIKLISDCFNQLSIGGYMFFVAISKNADTYKRGKYISKDRYELHKGVRMYFYDEKSVFKEFSKFGLIEINEIVEDFPFYIIKCCKEI